MKTPFRILLLGMMMLTFRAGAQNPDLEYFAKVPTRFKKPGLSPMHSFHMSRMGMPSNQWVANVMEVRLDLVRIKFSTRASMIFSGAGLLGFRRQSRDFYEVEGQTATERVNYGLAAPALSTAFSYGFFFPYFISVRAGGYYGWEGAWYKAYFPFQYSESDNIDTKDVKLTHSQLQKTGFHPYLSFELHRPWKSHFRHKHPMGWTVAYTYYPDNTEGNRSAWNYGIYWHIKSK